MSNVTISGNSQGGNELGYAETTTNATSTSTTNGNDAWAGLSITVTVGARPVMVEAWCGGASNGTAGDGGTLSIYEGATQLKSTSFVASGAAEIAGSQHVIVRLTPTAGSHTYIVKVNAVTGGTATFDANTTTNAFWGPAYIRAWEV